MQVALQLLALYAVVAFVPVIGARLVAGTDGARRALRVVYWRAPCWLVTSTYWLIVDCVTFFLPRPSAARFASPPPPKQDAPIMPPEPPRPASLAEKMQMRNAEELRLIRDLTDHLVAELTLKRAFELDLIDQITVQHQQIYSDDRGTTVPLASMSFVLRPPVSVHAASKGESDE